MTHGHRSIPSKDGGLILPVKFRTSIGLFDDVFVVGRWLIGYRQQVHPALWRSLEVLDTAEGQRAWLESCFQMQKEQSPETARRFLEKNGQFRSTFPLAHNPVVGVRDVLRSQSPLSEEEREKLRREIGKEQGSPTLILESDFWAEWNLLESVAEIAGKTATGQNPILLKDHLARIRAVVMELQSNAGKIAAQLRAARSNLTPERQRRPPKKQIEKSEGRLADVARQNLRSLLIHCFERAIGPLLTLKLDADATGSLGLVLPVNSVLGAAYGCLLANYSLNWKRCERSDCGNLFLASKKRTKYCDWYCGHIESVRRGRQK